MKRHGMYKKVVLITATVILVAGLVLAAVSFLSPANAVTAPARAVYATTVDCRAEVAHCMLYPQGGIVPIEKTAINKITKSLLFDIKAQVRADSQATVRGSLRSTVILGADGYWEKKYLDATEKSFAAAQAGSWTAHTTLQLDIPQLEGFIDRMEEETGIKGSGYLIRIVPEVSGDMALGGSTFQLQSVEPVVLQMEGGQISLQPQNQAADSTTTFPILGNKEFSAAVAPEPVILPLIGLSIMAARWISLALIALPLCLLAREPAKILLHRGHLSEEEQIDRRNHSRIICIRGGDAFQNKPTVELPSFQKLAAMAEQKELPLFKLNGESPSAYLVIDVGMIYRYTPGIAVPQEPCSFGKGEKTIESGID